MSDEQPRQIADPAQTAQPSARPGAGPSGVVQPPPSEAEREAQAVLDQVRTQAGGALSGRELRRRFDLEGEGADNSPPLDWRLTPRNILLQLGAALLFLAALGFMISLMVGGVSALFQTVGAG